MDVRDAPDTEDEVQDVLDALGRTLLQLQQGHDQGKVAPGHVDALFRHAHTLKGLFGLAGNDVGRRAASALEDLLDDLRMGRRPVDRAALERLFAWVEGLTTAVGHGARDPAVFAAVLAPLLTTPAVAAASGAQEGAGPVQTSAQAVPTELAGLLTAYEVHRFTEAQRSQTPVVVVTCDLATDDCEAQLQRVQVALAPLGELLTALPSMAEGVTEWMRFAFYLATLAGAEEVVAAVAAAAGQAAAGADGHGPTSRILTVAPAGAAVAAAQPAPADAPLHAPPHAPAHAKTVGAGAQAGLATGSEVAPAPDHVDLPPPQLLGPPRKPSPLRRGPLTPLSVPGQGGAYAVADDAVAAPQARALTPGRSAAGAAPSSADDNDASAPTGASAVAVASGDTPLAQTVRVDIRRLDRLMHWISELQLTKSALEDIGEALRRGQDPTALTVDLQRERYALARRLSELQAGVMAVRMVPLAQLFGRLVRAGHQAAHELGKEVRFEVHGETTEVDKFVAEKLVEPLVHLVRNAVDHGIEYPAARRAHGKPTYGGVRLSAQARGNQVRVEISDDGAGIDRAKVVQLALARGLLAEEAALTLADADVYRLICAPGFSTRSVVGAYSGRGVGLDVVKTMIEGMGGTLTIGRAAGGGTTFALTAPTTLAVVSALLLAVAGEQFAVPVTHVVQTVAVDADNLLWAHGRPLLRDSSEEAPLPLVALAEYFELVDEPAICRSDTEAAANAHAKRSAKPVGAGVRVPPYALIVGVGSVRIALAVDDLLGYQDIVLKQLGPRLRRARAFAGATELVGQRLVLVVDVAALLQMWSQSSAASKRAEKPARQTP